MSDLYDDPVIVSMPSSPASSSSYSASDFVHVMPDLSHHDCISLSSSLSSLASPSAPRPRALPISIPALHRSCRLRSWRILECRRTPPYSLREAAAGRHLRMHLRHDHSHSHDSDDSDPGPAPAADHGLRARSRREVACVQHVLRCDACWRRFGCSATSADYPALESPQTPGEAPAAAVESTPGMDKSCAVLLTYPPDQDGGELRRSCEDASGHI